MAAVALARMTHGKERRADQELQYQCSQWNPNPLDFMPSNLALGMCHHNVHSNRSGIYMDDLLELSNAKSDF